MKRFIVIWLATMLACWAADAQVLRFGARVGLNTGAYTFDQVTIDRHTIAPTVDRSSGYQVGLLMRLSIPKFIFVQPELDLVLRDYSFALHRPSRVAEYKNIRTVRLELPVMVGFKIGAARFFGGPVWRLDAHQHYKGEGETPFDVRFNDNDIAGMVGAGIDLDGLFVEVRYMQYLKETTSEITLNSQTAELTVQNDNLFQISFGVMF
ncbi:MAG: PorT family protein [Tidjanibacter sp.]|nr:PorT family protein [Tidjanibacter sp.]